MNEILWERHRLLFTAISDTHADGVAGKSYYIMSVHTVIRTKIVIILGS